MSIETNSAGKKHVGHERQARSAGAVLQSVETIASIVKTLTWPLIVLFLFVEFRAPFSESIALLPTMLKNASKVSAGGLSIEIERNARETGNPELAQLIGGLSRPALEILLRTGRDDSSIISSSGATSDRGGRITYNVPLESEIAALRELEGKKLIDPGVPIDEWYGFVRNHLYFVQHEGTRDKYEPKGNSKDVNAKDQTMLWSAHYRLTDLGLQSVDLILSSVSEELTSDSHDKAR